MGKLEDEILDYETIQKMSDLKKKLLKAERAKNLAQLESIAIKRKCDKQEIRMSYLEKRDATLTALEKSIPQRIETYKKKNAPLPVIQELELIKNMLQEEKEKIFEYREVEDEEEL